MPLQCDEFEYCKVKVHYVADPDVVDEKRESIVKNIKKQKLKVPGFRPGKASDAAIISAYKKQIDEAVIQELVAHAYDDVVFETKMKPIGYPQVFNTVIDGSNFWCDLVFLKKPEFELKQYTEFEIPKPHQEHTSADLTEKMMQDLRVRHGDVVPYGDGDFVQAGDQITLDFSCMIDGEKVEEMSKEGMLYDVGQNLIPDFDKQLYGMTAGENRKFDIIFGDDMPVEKYRDKRAKFDATVHMGTKTIPCALDDEFAKKLGQESYDKLRQEVQATACRQLDLVKHQMIAQQIITKLVEAHDFEVPPWLMLMESQNLARQQRMDWEKLEDEHKAALNERAKQSVKLSLILDSIREAEPEAMFSDDELLRNIKARADAMGQNGDEVLSRAQKDGSLFGMIASLRDEATIQWIVEKSKIIE